MYSHLQSPCVFRKKPFDPSHKSRIGRWTKPSTKSLIDYFNTDKSAGVDENECLTSGNACTENPQTTKMPPF